MEIIIIIQQSVVTHSYVLLSRV